MLEGYLGYRRTFICPYGVSFYLALFELNQLFINTCEPSSRVAIWKNVPILLNVGYSEILPYKIVDELMLSIMEIDTCDFNTILTFTGSSNYMNEAFTTHFQTQTITNTVDDDLKEIVISELVRKDTVLLSRNLSNHNHTIIFVAGKNCCLSDDNDTVVAEVSGYPILCQTTDEQETIINVQITPIIDIAIDKMIATLTLHPSLSGVPSLKLGDILALCKEHQINYGIDELSIQEALGQVENLVQPWHEIFIARGVRPVDGYDAFLRFEVEIGPLPGKILQDGSIDWRERKIFVGIEKNERIATKVPLTQGTAGIDIHGLSISQKPGNDINVKVTGGVQYIEESRLVIATNSGVLSVVNETDIKVSAKLTIEGDVDFSVGNIESSDAIEIKGNVNPGFTVMCKGDLSIGGNIHGAIVKTKGNSKIASGLTNKDSVLIADGDVEVAFVERGTITCGGTVVITRGAYYANISSKKIIMCRADSKIVGGTFCSCRDFIGSAIGSHNATPTTIAAGVDVERLYQRERLRVSIRDQEHKLKSLVHRYGQEHKETTAYKAKKTSQQKRIHNLKRLNLMPHSPLYSRHDLTYSYCSAVVAIQGQIVSGTKIRIGNARTTLKEDATAICFSIDRQTGHIVTNPYTEGEK